MQGEPLRTRRDYGSNDDGVNDYLNTPPTQLKRDILKEENLDKKKEMQEALNYWRITTPGPFWKSSSRRGSYIPLDDKKFILAETKVVYTAVFLTKESRSLLLKEYSPKFHDIKADHMTIQFQPKPEDVKKLDLGQMVTLKVIGYAEDNKVQAVVVEGFDSKNSIPHITISVAPGSKPVLSNQLLNKGYEKVNGPILHGIVSTFPNI